MLQSASPSSIPFVFVHTKNDVCKVYGIRVGMYHATLTNETKEKVRAGSQGITKLCCLVVTMAFGMVLRTHLCIVYNIMVKIIV